MSDYNLNVNIKIDASDLADAYTKVGRVLSELGGLGEVTKVDLSDKKPLHGHVPGCRMSDGRRSGTCTCGPVPR
jgi:hypothetical protein